MAYDIYQTILGRLRQQSCTAAELCEATGKHQATISRAIADIGNDIVKIREGRTIRYALAVPAFGTGSSINIGMISDQGSWVDAAILRPLASGGYFVIPAGGRTRPDATRSVLLGESGTGYFDDLPYFLQDMRPQGFIGRQIAQRMHQLDTSFPDNPERWNQDHVARYLQSNSQDQQGNLVLGTAMWLNVRAQQTTDGIRQEDYPRLAEMAMAGALPGYSAGGEQPKFSDYRGDYGEHVIVKFSPRESNPVAARWRDVLISEFHAAAVLQKHGFNTAAPALIEMDGRLFLEALRFDRDGQWGRHSMISLQSIDSEFVGKGDNWLNVASSLASQGRISEQDKEQIIDLWRFGQLIHNTDIHLGNLSLGIDGSLFHLLPVYDMCSMGLAPKQGEVPEINWRPDPDALNLPLGIPLRNMGAEFWDLMGNDERISEPLRVVIDRENFVGRCVG